MIIDSLKQIINKNLETEPLYLRNLLKEYLQYYVLNFIYNSRWGENFLLKGGSCLRMFFDLPRLSEDLDLDFLDQKMFILKAFLADLAKYFSSTLQYKDLEIKTSGKGNIIYLKFPILDKLGMDKTSNQTNTLFLRIDFAEAIGQRYKTEISLKSTWSFSFLVKRYSINDLMAGKLAAILQRTVEEKKIIKPRVKGRDYFDLAWFLEKNISPNLDYLKEITTIKNKKELRIKLKRKIKELDLEILRQDLFPLFKDNNFVQKFTENYKEITLRVINSRL